LPLIVLFKANHSIDELSDLLYFLPRQNKTNNKSLITSNNNNTNQKEEEEEEEEK